SKGRDKMSVAKQAVQRFITGLPSNANFAVFGFDARGSSERHQLGNSNRNEAKLQVELMAAGGGTPLGRSISYAMSALSVQARSQLGYGEYHLVVVTDGAASDAENLNRAIDRVLSYSPIVIHTVGFCIGQNHTLNRSGYTLYHAADNPESLMAGLNSVLAEAPDFDSSSFAGGS
ncbi:MAG: VWA domain-containing protein, partial [Acidiferrobacterales bacterium]|nr:VWA domain-containing protein [Acidiferrobacterales bacterium]